MNNITSLFPPNYKNLEQPAAIKLLEDIYTAAEEQDKTKLENGTLVELPCKVGDTVYTSCAMSGWYFKKDKRPYSAHVVFIGINNTDNFMNVEFDNNGHMLQFKFSDIGKTVFLTLEDAEKKLKEGVERKILK